MAQPLSIFMRVDEESWNAFVRRIRESKGEGIVVLSSADNVILSQEDERKHFLEEIGKIRYRLRLASKEPVVVSSARRLGIRVFDKTRTLRRALLGHERSAEVLRFFSPSLWRQHWRSRLQSVGLLAVPKVRIWVIVGLSAGLFFFVVFRLLPSATVQVWPRADVVTQTMNVTLVGSGGNVRITDPVREQPLQKITVQVHKAITFDNISPEFTGTDASVSMIIENHSAESYSFKKKTRVTNQAGMVFLLQNSVVVPANGKTKVLAKADHVDLYGTVIGVRGNVPVGLEWQLPGLSAADQKLISVKNLTTGTGGITTQRTVLRQSDLDIGVKRLKRELLADAKQLMQENLQESNATDSHSNLQLLTKDSVTAITYSGFILPTQFLGQPVESVPIEGSLTYTVPAYDLGKILSTYSAELQAHAGDGKRLIPDSVGIDPDTVIIIEYDDNLAWIKITVDITGTEQFVLDPLTPTGARFGEKVRTAIAGLSFADALKILRNFPEVNRIAISVWPPWSSTIPTIPSNIFISPQ